MFNPDPKPEKKVKIKKIKIKKLSLKREKENRVYLVSRKKHLEEFPECQIKFKGCTIQAVDLHHENGRIGSLLTDTRFFKSACRYCHDIVHNH